MNRFLFGECRIWVLALVIWATSGVFAAPVPGPGGPTRIQLALQAKLCRDILHTNLYHFYLTRSLDLAHNGYMESINDNVFALIGEKFLTLQARQLWFFSAVAIEGWDRKNALDAARIGFAFLNDKMRDPVNGGYYSKVTDDGKIKDTRKHVYLNSFALLGLTEYYRATGNLIALQSAQTLFRILEARAFDRTNGGYNEFFYANWLPITDPREPGYVGAIGTKTYNTHLHLMESFAELYRVWPDDLLRRRLQELMTINNSTVRFPRYDSNVDAFSPDWIVVNDANNLRASYGHDVECAWLMLDTARALAVTPMLYRNWAESIVRSSVESGFDRQNGGFFTSGPLGQAADDTTKVFWVQAESLVSMLELYRMTGNINYYDIFTRTLDFVEKFQVAKEGGWWANRKADGSPDTTGQRSSPWQGAYHAGRAMILSAHILDDLAARALQ